MSEAKIDDGGSAFPVCDLSQDTSSGSTTTYQYIQSGLSVRDYFAAKALQGLCNGDFRTFSDMAHDAYAIADAMIEARK